ncbi:hypothetical protein ABZW11_45270 [Nonomuraea sp. NPDC004580]|uniref:hypothetical protein n=1 Tax=Nonomuraea sp. NPDC004580 TaxID=3154552 RepID=UPI0033AEB8E4
MTETEEPRLPARGVTDRPALSRAARARAVAALPAWYGGRLVTRRVALFATDRLIAAWPALALLRRLYELTEREER